MRGFFAALTSSEIYQGCRTPSERSKFSKSSSEPSLSPSSSAREIYEGLRTPDLSELSFRSADNERVVDGEYPSAADAGNIITDNAGTSYKTTLSSAPTRSYPSSSNKNSSSASITSHASRLASLRDSLPENPHIYSFQEIATATNNFLNRSISASSADWRCSVRDKDVVVFQRRLRRSQPISELCRRVAILYKSHHAALAKLLGASLSGDYIYLVYEFIIGANLSDCLRNPKTPYYTVLSTWLSRMQIAEDVAHGIEYIHYSTGLPIQRL